MSGQIRNKLSVLQGFADSKLSELTASVSKLRASDDPLVTKVRIITCFILRV